MIRKIAVIALGFALAGIFTWLLARALDWRQVWSILVSAGKPWLGLALVVFTLGYAFRILRWQMLLRFTGTEAPYGGVAPALLAGFALNNILPLRLGDVMRTVMIRNAVGAPIAEGISTLLVERFWDLAVLGLFFVFGLQMADRHSASGLVSAATGIAALGMIALLTIALAGGPVTRLFEAVAARTTILPGLLRFIISFCRALAAVSKPRFFFPLALTSLAAWICEVTVLYLCARSLNIELSAFAVCFILSVANFSAILPGTPGNVGTFHYFAVLAAGAFAVNANYAAALAILFHAMVWAPITIVGGLFLAADSHKLRLLPGRVRNTG
jgi:uncharacterized protein (TIRG00374 family)